MITFGTVLLVTDRHSVEDAFGAALARDGFDVVQCPGPRPPTYTCIASCEGRCALTTRTDAVVLDTDLGSDLVGLGTRAWDLLHYYRDLGVPVVLLTDVDRVAAWPGDGTTPVLAHSSDPRSVVAAVRAALGQAPATTD